MTVLDRHHQGTEKHGSCTMFLMVWVGFFAIAWLINYLVGMI